MTNTPSLLLPQLKLARQQLFEQNHPDEARDTLITAIAAIDAKHPGWERRMAFDILAYAHLAAKRYEDAIDAFDNANNHYMSGYVMMLKGEVEAAYQRWQPLIKTRENHWAACLYGMLTRQLQFYPTFLHIRNHVEGDIINLARAGQLTLVGNIIMHAQLMSEINYEAYKFVGRALLYSGMIQEASRFLLMGQRLLPNDPEVYYHLGQYYEMTQQFEEAKVVCQQCLMMNTTYLPAKEMLERLSGVTAPH